MRHKLRRWPGLGPGNKTWGRHFVRHRFLVCFFGSPVFPRESHQASTTTHLMNSKYPKSWDFVSSTPGSPTKCLPWRHLVNVQGDTLLMILFFVNHRRTFRSQTSDNMDRWKAELGRGREKRTVEERESEKRKGQKKADADARKGRKVAKHGFSNDLRLRRVEK